MCILYKILYTYWILLHFLREWSFYSQIQTAVQAHHTMQSFCKEIYHVGNKVSDLLWAWSHRKMQVKWREKNKTKHLSMFRDEQLWTSCNFLYFYGAKKHRWIFRVRLLPVVQLLVILGCNLWLQTRVCAQTCCVIRYRGKIAYGNMWYSETQTEPLYLKPSTFEVLHFRFFFLFVFGSAKLSC